LDRHDGAFSRHLGKRYLPGWDPLVPARALLIQYHRVEPLYFANAVRKFFQKYKDLQAHRNSGYGRLSDEDKQAVTAPGV
jgi:hypothetical protein